jgi:hypothetical protein
MRCRNAVRIPQAMSACHPTRPFALAASSTPGGRKPRSSALDAVQPARFTTSSRATNSRSRRASAPCERSSGSSGPSRRGNPCRPRKCMRRRGSFAAGVAAGEIRTRPTDDARRRGCCWRSPHCVVPRLQPPSRARPDRNGPAVRHRDRRARVARRLGQRSGACTRFAAPAMPPAPEAFFAPRTRDHRLRGVTAKL